MRFSIRILLCIVGVLAHAGLWGDASIDTVLAHTYGYSNSKISDSKQCARPCKFGQKPMRCLFEFKVKMATIDGRPSIAINDQIPGPPIHVCLNDVVVVDVANHLQGGELAMHWHGVSQKGSPFMDGVPMVTQCPIVGGASYMYAFRAEEVGTHFYHAHSVSQQLNGVFGSIVVKQPAPLEPASSMYDQDRSMEDVLVISGAPSKFGSSEISDLLIDGRDGREDDYRRIFVNTGSRYRMRVINAIPVDCPVVMSVQKHPMTIIASDGRSVKSATVETFLLYPGERVDFILNSNQRPSTYGFYIDGLNHCKGLHQKALIIYDGSNSTELKSINNVEPVLISEEIISGQYLLDLISAPASLTVSPVAEKSVYLKVEANYLDVNDDDNEYRYLSDAMPVPPFYPASLSLDNKNIALVQINDRNFLYPNSPLLTQPNDIIKKSICNVGSESKNNNIECVQVLNVEYESTLELIIVDEGLNSNTSKTFHLHGNLMHIVHTSPSYENSITTDDVKALDDDEKIERNLLNPPRKDTIVVPNKGFVIVRIVADNIGTWMLECRSCNINSLPVGIVITVKPVLPEKVIDVLPKCGNFKRPDTLLN